MALYNLARMTTATTGTGTITLGSAVSGFLSFADAGASDGDTITYSIRDGTNSEIGRGTYTSSGTTLTRTVLKSTNSDSAISLSGSAEVVITPAASDLAQVAASNTFTENQIINATLSGTAVATAANYRADTAAKILDTDAVWDAMAEVTLTDGSFIDVDLSDGFDFVVTLGGNRVLRNPTNPKVGQRGRLRVVQDGTGSRTMSFESNYEFAGGSAPTLTSTASSEDILYYDVIASGRILIGSVLDIS